ncbi:hypothetical protein [Pedobacter agri]|uniref:hypothetical protein n=1 Tax=Pedobacter agri TaxID=454586 RepID=UPI00292F2558|nr:hypothetical protein [Pedobacter agri]
MQPIQDKDFDKLFKNAFEDAEITPSRDLWSNIESEIEPKKKRIFSIYWLAAAAVLLIATVGFLVYQQQDVQPKQFANNIEQSPKPIVETQPVQDSTKMVKAIPEEVNQIPTPSKPVESIAKTKNNKIVKPAENLKIITAPEMQKQEVMIAKVEPTKQDIKEKIDAAILEQDKPILASNPAAIKADVVSGEDNQADNKGIRNVGDVVNLIVNKVDKRKDKFIQFRTDDDDSSISSINIGPFKFGKKNKK